MLNVNVFVLAALDTIPESPEFKEPAVSVPVPEIVAAVLVAVAKLFKVTALETVTVIEGFTVRVCALPVKVIDAQAASTVAVIVCPFSMFTISPAVGNARAALPPEVVDQVAVEFQFPVALE